MSAHRPLVLLAALLALGPSTGCVKSMAINALGDALATPGEAFGRDDDPDFVCESSPFGLKTIESLIESAPDHIGLHTAAARGSVQYGYACLQLEADRIEDDDFKGARHLRKRASGMYHRAVRYGLAGINLEVEAKDIRAALRADPKATLADFEKEHVPLLYWTAMGWAAGVALDKDDVELAADLGLVEHLMDRVAELDPDYGEGAVHDFYLSWEMAQPGGDAQEKAKRAKDRMDKAFAASGEKRLSPLVTYAESVLVSIQDGDAFDAMLDRVLAFDLDSAPRHRLVNTLAQRRARWLKSRKDDLFL